MGPERVRLPGRRLQPLADHGQALNELVRRWRKPALGVAASSWFGFGVFLAALAAGVHVLAHLDERIVERGDELHGFFAVAAEPGENGRPFRALELAQAEKQGPETSFMMSKPEGSFVSGDTTVSYRVLENTERSQVIEVEEKDDDKTMWSRYRASKAGVAPISSRAWYFGYLFAAFPWALGFSFIVNIAARLLKKRHGQ